MRKFLFGVVSLLVVSALITGTMIGCKDKESENQSDTLDTAVIKPNKVMQDSESATQGDENQDVIATTGEVVDVSKSNVTIKTDDGEQEFEFEDLRDSGTDYYHSMEGDKITVKYVKENAENGLEMNKVVGIEKAE